MRYILACTILLALSQATALAQQNGEETASTTESTGESVSSEEAAPEESDEDYDPRQIRTNDLNDERAQAQYQVGRALYDSGRYNEAAREWLGAYELSQRPSMLFNAYLAYRDAGNLRAAVNVLGRYLETNPEIDDAERLQHRYEAMRTTLEELDEEEAREREEAEERERQLAAEREAERLRAEEQARLAEEQRQRAYEAENRVHPAGWAVMGLGAGMLVGAGAAGILALESQSVIEENCSAGSAPEGSGLRCASDFPADDRARERRRRAIASDVLFVAGGITTVTGLIMLFTLRKNMSEDGGAPNVSFGCGPAGCSASVRGEF